MKDKKLFKLMKKQNKFTKNKLVKCNCGRKVKINNITWIYPIDVNYFDWWMYGDMSYDENKKKIDFNKIIVRKKPWGYIGYIPILNDIVYYIHKIFHKKIYILDIECKYCKNE